MRYRPAEALALGTMMVTGAPAGAQDSDPVRVRIPRTEVHSLQAQGIDQEFEVWIAHPVPGVIPLPPGPRQVVYVLDANLFFGTAVEMTRIMAQLYGELPPLVVVGIAYPTDDGALQAELRARDFTPVADPGLAAMASGIPGAREPSLPEGERLGKADRFLEFLVSQVRPFVEARIDVAPGGSVLFGSSLGGLFAAHALFTRPDAFDAYIAVSPALWWGNEEPFAREEALADSVDDLNSKLVLAVGGLEENPAIPMLARFRMVTNVRRMAQRLAGRGYASLEVHELVLEGESHTSVVPVALTRGLRRILGRP